MVDRVDDFTLEDLAMECDLPFELIDSEVGRVLLTVGLCIDPYFRDWSLTTDLDFGLWHVRQISPARDHMHTVRLTRRRFRDDGEIEAVMLPSHMREDAMALGFVSIVAGHRAFFPCAVVTRSPLVESIVQRNVWTNDDAYYGDLMRMMSEDYDYRMAPYGPQFVHADNYEEPWHNDYFYGAYDHVDLAIRGAGAGLSVARLLATADSDRLSEVLINRRTSPPALRQKFGLLPDGECPSADRLFATTPWFHLDVDWSDPAVRQALVNHDIDVHGPIGDAVPPPALAGAAREFRNRLYWCVVITGVLAVAKDPHGFTTNATRNVAVYHNLYDGLQLFPAHFQQRSLFDILPRGSAKRLVTALGGHTIADLPASYHTLASFSGVGQGTRDDLYDGLLAAMLNFDKEPREVPVALQHAESAKEVADGLDQLEAMFDLPS